MQLQYWLHIGLGDRPKRCTKGQGVAERERISRVLSTDTRDEYDVGLRGETGVHNRVELRRYAFVVSFFPPTEVLPFSFPQLTRMEDLKLLTEVNSPYVSSTRRVHKS